MGSACTTCTKQGEGIKDRIAGGPSPVAVDSEQARAANRKSVEALKNFALSVTNGGEIAEFYEVSATILGMGAFGTVMRAKDKKAQQDHAVKVLCKKMDDIRRLHNEVQIMSTLDHPHIVRLQETFQDPDQVFLVMEVCEGGELFDRICEEHSFSEHVAARCVQQMLLAMNYLHHSGIMHRDLKPQNWLLKSKCKVPKAILKLIDFGVSKRFGVGEQLTSKVGTPPYFAPEVLSGNYNSKADIWSIGVIAYILIAGKLPFSGKSTVTLLMEVKAAEIDFDGPSWEGHTPAVKSFVQALLHKDPQGRASATDALQHIWLQISEAEDSKSIPCLTGLDLNRLKAWGRSNNLKKAALEVIATQLDNKRIDHLRVLFTSLDSDQDGKLSVAEMKEGFTKAGAEIPSDLQALFQAVDVDGSGSIDYTEFLAATLNKKRYLQRDVVWAAFQKFDKNGNGQIDRDELELVFNSDVTQVMHLENKNALEDLLKEVDTNGDGVIGFEEFFAMLSRHSKGDAE